MKELIVIDDFLSKEDHHEIYNLTMKRKWNSINDSEDDPLSGQSGYNSGDRFHERGTQIILSECLVYPNLKKILETEYGQTLYNKYEPKTPTYFHTDSDDGGWTLIYFPDIAEYDYQMGGETQILVDNQIVGVLPLPNRLMAFDGSLMHKGTSFTNNQLRYSLALQFGD
tara:strand:- start:267 stop:773 length:507 start_codon:yes stop_codon:yes gene_type:complete